MKILLQPGKPITILTATGLFIVLPFVYSIRLQDMEMSPRFLVLSVLTAINSFLLLISYFNKPIQFPKAKGLAVAAGFLLVYMVAFFRSINTADALFELLKLMILAVLFIQVLVILTENEKNKFIFLKCITVSAWIFLVFAIVQLAETTLGNPGTSFLKNINYNISSTLGNKNFFAETLLLMTPFIFMNLISGEKAWKMFSVFTLAVLLTMLLFLQTFSVWAALFVGAVMGFFFAVRYKNVLLVNSERKIPVKKITVALIAGAVVFAFLFIRLGGVEKLQSRLTTLQHELRQSDSITSIENQNSTYERIVLWKNALKVTSDFPFLGCGLANWKIIAPAYGFGRARYMESGSIRFVNPHNDFLNVASETGITGLAMFVWMLVLFFLAIRKRIAWAKTRAQLLHSLSLMSVLVFYVTISCFSMPLSRIYPPVLLLFAMAFIYSENYFSRFTLRRSWLVSMLIISFGISLLSSFIGFKRVQAEVNLSAALLKERKHDYDMMRRHLDKIDTKYYPLDVTATPIDWYRGFCTYYLGDYERAFGYFRKAETINPNHMMVLSDLGSCYNQRGEIMKAKNYFLRALKLQPGYGNALVNLSVIYFNAGEKDNAFTTLVKYTGPVQRDWIPIFKSIIMWKGESEHLDENILNELQKRVSRPDSLVGLLNEIRSGTGDFQKIKSSGR